jgi:hypothetical protein
MTSHDLRDLDGVIDDVARAMTDARLAHDLRPAVTSRIASPAPRGLGWRTVLAGAAVAAAVLVLVVMRPAPAPQRPQAGGGRVATRVTIGPAVPPAVEPDAIVPEGAADGRTATPRGVARPVARQTIDDAQVAGVVDISPLEIVPLAAEDEGALTASHVVDIAPIEVEPVAIDELELIE